MKFLIKICLSIAVLYFAFRNIDHAAVLHEFQQVDLISLSMAFLLVSLSTLLAATRWRMVTLNTEGDAPELLFFVKSFYRGAFINQGLPTTLGGDALRVADLAHVLGSKREAFGTVLLDRMIGLSGLLIINVLMFPLSLTILPTPFALAVAGISAGGLISIAIILALPWHRLSHRHKVLHIIAELNAFGRRVLAHPRGFLLQCTLSVSVHTCAILGMFVLARQFGVDADLWTHLVIQPTVFIAALLPISLAGWGLREGSMAAIFTTIGVAAPAVIATSLCYGLILLVSTLPGLLFLMQQSGKKPIATDPERNIAKHDSSC